MAQIEYNSTHGRRDDEKETTPNAFVQDNLLAFTSSEAVTDAIDTHGGEVVVTNDDQDDLTISLAALR